MRTLVNELNDNLANLDTAFDGYLMRGIVADGLIEDANLCTSKGTYDVYATNALVANLPTIADLFYGILEVNTGTTGGTFVWQKLRLYTGTEYNRCGTNGVWMPWA